MNPFHLVTGPIRALADALLRPLQAVFVVGLCFLINRMTSPGHPWWHWVALGMGISVLVAWARAAKFLLLLAAAWYVGRWIHARYGDAAKARFDEWVGGRGTTPGAANGTQAKDAKDLLRLVGDDRAIRAAGIVA